MTVDIESVLASLGIDFGLAGHEASALCPMHEKRTGKIDRNPSWFINLESGMHICFSCGYKGNVVQLVCDVKEFYQKSWGQYEEEYDYKAGREWLASVTQVTPERLLEILKSLPSYLPPDSKPLEMSEARLAVFVEPPQEALDSRSITPAAAQMYGIMWDNSKKTWILPLRDPHFHQLLGWQEKGTIDRTFKNRPAGLTKSSTLFGIENQNEDTVIVVESPLDCARIASAGIHGAVAVCGSSVSEAQVKLLRYSEKIVIAFDNPNIDKAGKKACDEMRVWGRKYGMNVFFFNYGSSSAKDPGDMTDEELQWGIDNAKSAIYGEQAYVQGNAQTVSG